MIKAVITGDIIDSGKLKPEEKEFLTNSLRKRLKVWDAEFNMKSELYRGDSFQCLLNNPTDVARVALLIKTFIKCLNPSKQFDLYEGKNPQNKASTIPTNVLIDSRISIGIGEVDLEMKSVATSDGIAFNLSGTKLDKIKGTKQSFAISSDDTFHEELETEAVLLDNILSRATALQCEVINLKLLGYTEIKIANMLKIKQSAVNQRSNGSGWNAIEVFVNRFETVYGNNTTI